ncbi:MAG: hypothetical protein K8T91_27465 [Planctomycetes bacterium]|nr:hypothetical protein [Planctomycetota bacterium]
MILTAGFLLAILNTAAAQTAKPTIYEANSLLRVRQGPGVIYDLDSGALSLAGQRELIRSPLVINYALSVPGVSKLPWIASRSNSRTEVEWLGRQIELSSFGGQENEVGDVLKISMKGDDPAQLERLVNAVTDAYLEMVAREERRQLLARQNLLDVIFTTKTQEVNRRRELVRKLEERLGAGNSKTAPAKQQLLLDFILQLRKEITEVRSLIFHKQFALEQFVRLYGLKKGTEAEAKHREQAEHKALAQELEELKAKEAAMSQKFKELSKSLEDQGKSSEDLERFKYELAAVEATTKKLLMTLEQFDLELRSPERITLLQKATVPRLPLEDK